MRRLTFAIAIALTAALWLPLTAQAQFGVSNFDSTLTNQDGSPATQAGSHPFAATITTEFNYSEEGGEFFPEGRLKDLIIGLMGGLIGDATAYPRCSNVEFTNGDCPNETAIGVNASALTNPNGWFGASIYSLVPPPGVLFRAGFQVVSTNIIIDLGVKGAQPYNVSAAGRNIPELLNVFGAKAQVWGNPSDPAHDSLRGSCYFQITDGLSAEEFEFESQESKTCPVAPRPRPLLTLPTRCTGPNATTYATDSWEAPGALLVGGEPDLTDPNWVTGGVENHDAEGNPQPFTGCGKLRFLPSTESRTSSENAETGTGYDFSVDFHDEGLTSTTGLAQSEVKKAIVTLPQGVTINPSVGEGLAVCTPANLARETLFSAPGEGCPNASKLGSLETVVPLVDEPVKGSIFLAQQDDAATTTPGAENPFDSLIALYLVLRNTDLGALVKLPVKVEPDPNTGQLLATLEDAPQIPFSHANFHFREGARAPLITPSACGTYTTTAQITPWANPAEPLTSTSSFQITRGVHGGACPPAALPPFHPQFQAGSINNNAGSFSPFDMRLIRSDGEQDMTKFSSVLPPGEVGSLVGVSKCADSAIALARSKTGRQEIASPSCPQSSLIGHTLAGAGVGEALTYVGGQIYLGGPYHGDPLSVISVTPAVAGPFDAGTVVVRLALTLNPKTAEVEVDGAASDPIPHILKGIVLKVRDLRVHVDRPNFLLNPTSCDESSARATLFGSYLNVLDPNDDKPVDLSTRYQAANCLNLGFKPKLELKLKGGTKRGGHPGLIATYKPKKGDANVKGLITRLPRSAFLDQAHIRTICTRVQFAAKACPPGAQYGFIKAWTPLLEEPLEGPVYLRSSNHKLPDLVFDLHGLVDVEVSVRIDSARGGIRATLEDSPDAPLSKVVLKMQGQKKGLIINSRNLCGGINKANVSFEGHNGKRSASNPVMGADCGGGRGHKRHQTGKRVAAGDGRQSPAPR
jgi:hypothetical protein